MQFAVEHFKQNPLRFAFLSNCFAYSVFVISNNTVMRHEHSKAKSKDKVKVNP